MNWRLVIAGILLITGSFLTGTWVSHHFTKQDAAVKGRKILHYVDPMHPSYTSDKPGIAPDCGMPLEPVYTDGNRAPAGNTLLAALPPGTVQVSPDQQQLVGVKTGVVERTGGYQELRLQGRVAPDELRTYVINATIDGWITGVGNSTTGSIVRKNEVLAKFYSPEFLSAGQALIYALNSMDRSMGTAGVNQAQKDQMQQFNVSLKQYRDSLRNLGMGDQQIDEMIRTRKYMENVDIVAPGNGLVTVRNISPGQRFERGKELYRIVDISRVWILVDTYGADADFLKPGMRINVSLPNRNRAFIARVANIPPQFDPASRTLKVRLEVDNPGNILRPDMFVDVELPMQMPSMLSVQTEALIDSGLKKTVFVDKGNGVFEPREVETGRNFGNLVEILSGLKAGERIAISGTFLLDSESRMKTAAAGISSTPQQDPACGMYVDELKALAAGHTVESCGGTNYFCSEECKQKFLKRPAAKTAHKPPPASVAPSAPAAPVKSPDTGHKHD
ncbi:MAG: efflux RND transporter periplasmic adaptor subunit [Verrucomicrobia bacterium]|nr:efflux RND transporter periplasmic adaptor subunit [Deltaproteobacteria bacterium]